MALIYSIILLLTLKFIFNSWLRSSFFFSVKWVSDCNLQCVQCAYEIHNFDFSNEFLRKISLFNKRNKKINFNSIWIQLYHKVTKRTDHLIQQNGSGKVLKDVLGWFLKYLEILMIFKYLKILICFCEIWTYKTPL